MNYLNIDRMFAFGRKNFVFYVFCCLFIGIGGILFLFPSSGATIKRVPLVNLFFPECDHCNVIFLSIDTLGVADLPCFGYSRNTAPNLCNFASNHTLFSEAYSDSSWTLPSHMSIFTSQLSSVHQVRVSGKDVLNPEIKTMPEVLKLQGYHTIWAGLLESDHLPLKKGLGRGFDSLNKYLEIPDWIKAMDEVKAYSDSGVPSFLFIHTNKVHDSIYEIRNYNVPLYFDDQHTVRPLPLRYPMNTVIKRIMRDYISLRISQEQDKTVSSQYSQLQQQLSQSSTLEQASGIFSSLSDSEQQRIALTYLGYKRFNLTEAEMQYLRDIYDDGIRRFDAELKDFLDVFASSGLAKNTILIITGDHGEEFGEHGDQGHGWNLYNTVTHVPLILAVPNIKPQRISSLVQNADIFPTLVSLIGVRPPPSLFGQNLKSRIVWGWESVRPRYLLSDLGDHSEYWSIRSKEWKLYTSVKVPGTFELYNMATDTNEKNNVSSQYEDVIKKLVAIRNTMMKLQPSFPSFGSRFSE